jgi:glutathione S-transferase
VIRRQEAAIDSCLKFLDHESEGWGDEFAIGQIAVAAALAYLDFRSPEIGWRDRTSSLAIWCDRLKDRSSVIAARLPT